MGELEGKVAIVTGAGRLRSIGRGAALALARRGASVVVVGTGRDPATYPEDEKVVGWRDIESVADEIREMGQRALPVIADVSDAQSVDELVEKTVLELGRVDILVNNAASPKGADRVPAIELERSQFSLVFAVKVFGSFYCAQAVARKLVEQGDGGKIVNVSSIAGKIGPPSALVYGAANAAVDAMTKSLARELGPYGVNVNSVCPGFVETVRWDDMLGTETWEKMVSRGVPLQRATDGDEVGEFIAFLCSVGGSYLQGQCINFDGGKVMEH